jgi:hypothetical protein
MIVKILTHYSTEDPDQMGDYISVEVFVDDKVVKSYRDAYHEDGLVKAEAWCDGFEYANDLAGLGLDPDESVHYEQKSVSDIKV